MENLITEKYGADYFIAEDGRKVCTGAKLGRHSSWDASTIDTTKTIDVTQVTMFDGDYDNGGAYWGYSQGSNVYEVHATSTDGELMYHTVRAGSTLEAVLEALGDDKEDILGKNPKIFAHCSRVKGLPATDISSGTKLMEIPTDVPINEMDHDYLLEALKHAIIAVLWMEEPRWNEQRDARIEEEGEGFHLPTDMELDVEWQVWLLNLITKAEGFRLKANGEQLPARQLGHEIGMLATGSGDAMRLPGWPEAFEETVPDIHWELEKAEVLDEGLIR